MWYLTLSFCPGNLNIRKHAYEGHTRIILEQEIL